MAYTQTQLDALDAAIAQGALEVEHNGRRVRYRSQEEMLRLRRLIAKELGTASTASGRKFLSFDKGV